jgi:hypothetical protein
MPGRTHFDLFTRSKETERPAQRRKLPSRIFIQNGI